MKVVPIDLSLIDFKDHTFYTGNKGDISSLKNSILELGLLNPPILREKDGGYQVVSGWKRLISCLELGHLEVLCSVYGSEFSDRDSLEVIFLDNKDRISELELSELIALHKTLCELGDKELVEEVLPRLHIPSSRKHLDKYLALASLQKDIKNAFFEDKITIEQCQMLSELPTESRAAILERVLLKYKLNNNETRQVIQHISEIASTTLKSILDTISEAEKTIDGDKIDKNELRASLRRMRYPDLSAVEEKVKKRVHDLNLPKSVNLVISQFFQANDAEFRIKVKSSEELLKICNKLEILCEKGEIDRIISLIKEGE